MAAIDEQWLEEMRKRAQGARLSAGPFAIWHQLVDDTLTMISIVEAALPVLRAVASDYDYSGCGAGAFCAFHQACGLRMVVTPHGNRAERFVHTPDCPITLARRALAGLAERTAEQAAESES